MAKFSTCVFFLFQNIGPAFLVLSLKVTLNCFGTYHGSTKEACVSIKQFQAQLSRAVRMIPSTAAVAVHSCFFLPFFSFFLFSSSSFLLRAFHMIPSTAAVVVQSCSELYTESSPSRYGTALQS